MWSLILQDHGPPEGRGHNQRTDQDKEDAQGGEEGGRRGEKEEVQIEIQDPHTRNHCTTGQHLSAVTPQNTRSLWDHRLSVLSGPPRFPKGNTFEKLTRKPVGFTQSCFLSFLCFYLNEE